MSVDGVTGKGCIQSMYIYAGEGSIPDRSSPAAVGGDLAHGLRDSLDLHCSFGSHIYMYLDGFCSFKLHVSAIDTEFHVVHHGVPVPSIHKRAGFA